MNPAIAANQQRTFLTLFGQLRPFVERDAALPRRIKELLGKNRSFGSRDRRLYRELIYTAIRFLPWIDPLFKDSPETAARVVAFLAPDTPATKAYRAATLGDWTALPSTATLAERAQRLRTLYVGRANPPGEPNRTTARPEDSPYRFDPQALLPEWFREHCPAAFESPNLDVLNERASLWIRLQTNDRDAVLAEFRERGWAAETLDAPDGAVRLPADAAIEDTDAYERGAVEVQDLGSQLVLLHAPIAAGQTWLDACAGAGGKTLQLARLVGPTGRVDATDIRPKALAELADRARRAQLKNVRITAKPDATYDGVLVDAPCSGTGTWRRLPHMKWFTKPEAILVFAAEQLNILSENAARIRPGGLLIYATCSLSHHENRDVVAAFLKSHPDFKPELPTQNWSAVSDGLGRTLLPAIHNTDGFYVATLRRSS